MNHHNVSPKIDKSVFVAPGAVVIGDVEIGAGSSIWFNTVLRGDVNYIRVGKNTNIQDLSMVHVAAKSFPTIIGDNVTVGHRAIVHACSIGNRCLVGMGSIVMDGAVIEDDCIIAAGALVPEGMHVPKGSVAKGSPAKITRTLRPQEYEWIKRSASDYALLAATYIRG